MSGKDLSLPPAQPTPNQVKFGGLKPKGPVVNKAPKPRRKPRKKKG